MATKSALRNTFAVRDSDNDEDDRMGADWPLDAWRPCDVDVK
jgi:hypothetical protein